MIVRSPRFDFSTTTPHWLDNREFAHVFNAMSLLFPPLERFLIRVMMMARTKLAEGGPDREGLRQDIELFTRQEGVHFAIHTEFNTMLARNGFPDLPAFEAEMDESYRQLLKGKSLKFLTAYCASFETFGPTFANIWLDEIEDLFEGGESNAVAMWKWHISEEYEHRTVCHDVYQAVSGGYFYRLWSIVQTRRHMDAFVGRVLNYLLKKEWASMTAEQVAASKRRLKAVNRRVSLLVLKHLWRAYLPGYSPRKEKPPRNYPTVLNAIEERYIPRAA